MLINPWFWGGSIITPAHLGNPFSLERRLARRNTTSSRVPNDPACNRTGQRRRRRQRTNSGPRDTSNKALDVEESGSFYTTLGRKAGRQAGKKTHERNSKKARRPSVAILLISSRGWGAIAPLGTQAAEFVRLLLRCRYLPKLKTPAVCISVTSLPPVLALGGPPGLSSL